MIQLIKAYKFSIIAVLILVFVIILQKCDVKHTDNVINGSELSTAINHVKDSLKTLHYQELIANYKAGQQAEAIKTVAYKHRAAGYKTELERLKHISDSLIEIYPIDTICRKIVSAKQAEIDTLNASIELIGQEAESYSKQLYLCDKASIIKDTIIIGKTELIQKQQLINDKLLKELKGKQNWFERNKLWIGVVAGAVGGWLIVR